jgi:type II secretory pathway pseudopilin PulG
MKTKRLTVVFALVLAAGLPGFAQQADGGGQRDQFQQRLQTIKQRLQMTPDQSEKVRPVVVQELQQMKAVREKYGDGQDRRSRLKMVRELRDIRSSTDEQLKAILSKQQMDELKKIREEWREQYRQRRNR